MPQPEPEPVQRGGKPQALFTGVTIPLEPVGRGPQVPDALREPPLPSGGLVGEERLPRPPPGEKEQRRAAPQPPRLPRAIPPPPRELPPPPEQSITPLQA